MRFIPFFALFLLAATTTAQTPTEQIKRLQNDANIIWVGEIYRDYQDIDNTYEGRNIDRSKAETLADGSILNNHVQTTTILKLQNNNGGAFFWADFFTNQLIQKDVKAFADADLSTPLTEKQKDEATTTVQTIRVYDPEIMEEVDTKVVNEFNPKEIYGYRIRQLIYYNAKENMYYNLPLSLAPLKFIKDAANKNIGLKPLFWLPISVAQQPIMPNNAANMPFVKSIRMQLPFADIKPLKESKTTAETKELWFADIKKQQNTILATDIMDGDNSDKRPLSPKEIAYFFEPMDTMMTFDPVTLAPLTPIYQTMAANSKNLFELRCNYNIGWDEKNKAITIFTHSLSPMVKIYDDKNNLLFIRPLFYLYPHRRFKATK